MWVRKCYARFPTTQIFPIELGALTIVSLCGGLFVYEEYRVASWGDLAGIYSGMVLMTVGMVTLAFCKPIPAGITDHSPRAAGSSFSLFKTGATVSPSPSPSGSSPSRPSSLQGQGRPERADSTAKFAMLAMPSGTADNDSAGGSAEAIHNGSGDETDSALPLEARQPVLGGTQVPRQASHQVPGTPAGITQDQP